MQKSRITETVSPGQPTRVKGGDPPAALPATSASEGRARIAATMQATGSTRLTAQRAASGEAAARPEPASKLAGDRPDRRGALSAEAHECRKRVDSSRCVAAALGARLELPSVPAGLPTKRRGWGPNCSAAARRTRLGGDAATCGSGRRAARINAVSRRCSALTPRRGERCARCGATRARARRLSPSTASDARGGARARTGSIERCDHI